MTINIGMSVASIESAASALEQILENLKDGVDETVDILTRDGRDEAANADGGMATVTMNRPDRVTGIIEASGDAAIIAEFGAGDDTIESIPFDNPPPVPVYRGSYSELVGTQEYYATGKWHFGGKEYRAVPPRQGLYKAKERIISKATSVAQGAIHL